MRLVIKEYLLQLKEKDELDFLICDLLLQMGFVTENKPKSGIRQYGVDIRAHNRKETLLCVIKQGDIDRNNWDNGPDSVRQSLNEIMDVYIQWIGGEKRNNNLRIAIIINGIMSEAVRPNWEFYVQHNTNWVGINVSLELWDIDQLVEFVQEYLFDEHIFGNDMQRLLRKALYFIGESDYHKEYYEHIIDQFIEQIKVANKPKTQKKLLAGLYLSSQMVAQYAAEERVFKIAINVTEYLILRYWNCLLVNKIMGRGKYREWLLKFIGAYEKWNWKYYEAVKECCIGNARIPMYNVVEQRVLLYELLGYLTAFAYYLLRKEKGQNKEPKNSVLVCDSIINLINNYPQILYAPYDNHVGIISMLYRFLDLLGREDEVCILLKNQCKYLEQYYLMEQKYPTPTDTFADAVNIYMGEPAEDYKTSGFWGTMLEWIVVMHQQELYDELRGFLKDDLKEVTKCVWFLRKEEEMALYSPYAMYKAGEGIALTIEDSFEAMKEKIEFIMAQYEDKHFSYEEYSFEALEFIVCRYFGYLPKVKRER